MEEQNLTDKSEEELNRQFNQLNAVHDELNRQFGVNKEKLDANAQRKKQHSEIQAQFLQQKSVADNWSYLNKLIGSADGKTYRKMVQRMSLEILIDYANEQMSILAPRYQLTLPQKVSNNANSENNSETIKSTPANGKEDMKYFALTPGKATRFGLPTTCPAAKAFWSVSPWRWGCRRCQVKTSR